MSGIPRRALDSGIISPAKFIQGLTDCKFYYGRWYGPSPRVSDLDGFSTPNLADTNVNIVFFNNGLYSMVAQQYLIGARSSDVGLWTDAVNDWLEVNPEPTASEGIEYILGAATTAANPFSTTIGDATVRNKGNRRIVLNFNVEDEANVAECAVGFRKAENNSSVIDNYDEMAVLNAQYDTDDNYIRIETILNGGTTVTTETGLTLAADTDTIFEVRLIGRKPKFFVNGQDFETSFQFDEGEVVVPFVHFLQNATGSCEFRWKELAVGDEADFNESLQF